jgi:ATP-dependent Zn protease
VKFFACSGSEFDDSFVGIGARRIRQLFAEARANTPCIIFMDEIDALGSRSKKNRVGGGSTETLNQFLVELDGFTGREGIILIGATNLPSNLDKAMIR